jgi:hypothetical protein
MNERPGCLLGLFKLFLLDKVYNWLQARIGFGSGSCLGCGCGVVLLFAFISILFSIIFGTNWLKLF